MIESRLFRCLFTYMPPAALVCLLLAIFIFLALIPLQVAAQDAKSVPSEAKKPLVINSENNPQTALEGTTTKAISDEDDDDEDEDTKVVHPWANLNIELADSGIGTVVFSEMGVTSSDSIDSRLLQKAFGCQFVPVPLQNRLLQRVEFRGDSCRVASRSGGLHYFGRINLRPILDPLRQSNLAFLSVSLWQMGQIPLTCAPEPQSKWGGKANCAYSLRFAGVDSQSQAAPKIMNGAAAAMFVPAENFPGFEFSYGMSGHEIARGGLILGIILLLPIFITLWMRRAALRAAERIAAGLRCADASTGQAGSLHDDRAGIWFGYWKSLNWMLNGALILWWGADDAVHLRELLSLILRLEEVGQLAWASRLLTSVGIWFPPLMVVAACQVLSHPVQVHVRGLQWTRGEVFRQSVWSIVAGWLPLLLFLNGFTEIFSGNSRIGVIWMAVAFFGRTYAVRQSALAQGLIPRALTSGELRNSIFTMAAKLKLKLAQVYVISTGKARMANAFARSGNSILLTDVLLGNLTRREVDAVVAHELGHLKHNHPRKLGMAWALGLMAAIFMMNLVPARGVLLRAVHYLLIFVVPSAITYFFSRIFEFTADKEAVLLTGDAEAQITSLVKLHRLNLTPLDWGRVQGKFLTHPSTRRRAQAIARVGGISPERVPEILERALHVQQDALSMDPLNGFGAAPSNRSETPARADHPDPNSEPSPLAAARVTASEFKLASLTVRPLFPAPLTSDAQAKDIAITSNPIAIETSGKTAATLIGQSSAASSTALADFAATTQPPSDVTERANSSSPATASKYSLPASAGAEEKLFSSTYKSRNAFRNAWLYISSLVLPPVMVALVVQHYRIAGVARWGAYTASWFLTLACSLAVRNFLQSWEALALRRQLKEKLEREGADPAAWGGRFVGLSPHGAPRSYENMTVWDIGYLFVNTDRICYWGEETRFALSRDQIESVRLAAGPPSWFGLKSIYIGWRDGEKTGTFNLRVGDVSNDLAMVRQTSILFQRLQSWMQRPISRHDLPPSLAKLGPPQFGAVTGAPLKAGVKPRALFRTMLLLWLVGWAVSVLCGLPVLGISYPIMYLSVFLTSAAVSSEMRYKILAAMPAVPGWHVILTAWTVYLVLLIPNLMYREPSPPDKSIAAK